MAITGQTNYIQTQTGEGLTTSINNTFNQFPYLDQLFNAQVKECAQNNALNNCTNPPSLSEIDNNIIRTDNVVEFLLTNDIFDRETRLFQFQTIIEFFKIKKCINGQFPCWSHNLYEQNIDFLNQIESEISSI